MSDKGDPTQHDQERRLKRKQSLEAAVTAGCGYGKKKQRVLDAFYNTIWPILDNGGWTMVKGQGEDEGAVNFLPPGIEMGTKYAKRKPYFQNIKDVIERVLERTSSVESKAADAYYELFHDEFDGLKVRRVVSPHQHNTRRKCIDADWKNDRKHYMKTSSRVGKEYQVDEFPAAGTYASACVADEAAPLYDQLWDKEKAEKSGKISFVHTRVKYNKREAAMVAFHERDYRLPGFYEEVCRITPTDGSVWTNEEKEQFKKAIFREHKNMRQISKIMSKPIKECLTYYLGTFKQTEDYPELKKMMHEYKYNLSKGIAPVVCDGCGKGGTLIVCDTCESHYHLSCTSPPLESVPEGSWNCSKCDTKPPPAPTNNDMEVDCNAHNVEQESAYPNTSGPAGVVSRNDEPGSSVKIEMKIASCHADTAKTEGDYNSKKMEPLAVSETSDSSM